MSRRSLLLGICLLAAGCGGAAARPDKPELAPVTGKLVQNGKPLADAFVEFTPEAGATSTGRSDAEGNFQLTYADGTAGAKVGGHKVRVTVGGMLATTADAGPTPKTAKPPTPPTLYVIPDAVKVAAGPNTLELTVPAKGQPG